MDASAKENLYILMDENYERCYGKKQFWKELHKIDAEITPGCIRMEKFKGEPAKDMRGNVDASEAFFSGTQTIVIELKNPKTVLKSAELLNQIFMDTGTRFIPEAVGEHGHKRYQLRSNIDKLHWGKLGVFLKYRHEREVPRAEHDAVRAEVQKTITSYIDGTDCKAWGAVEGMPAFCSLMGLHGNLRPAKAYPADTTRKHMELNSPHTRGNPVVFDGITIHVDLDKNGALTASTPYTLGYNPTIGALEKAHDDTLLSMAIEACGGNPFSRHLPLSNRLLKAAGLGAGMIAIATGETLPVIMCTTAMAGGLLVGYMHKRWEVLGHLNELRDKNARQMALIQSAAKPAEPAAPLTTAQERAMEDMQREAFSAESMKQLHEAIEKDATARGIKSIADNPQNTRPEDNLHTSLYGGLAGLRFR